MSTPRSVLFSVLVGIASAAGMGCTPDPQQRMVEELSRHGVEQHPILGPGPARAARRKLEALPATAPTEQRIAALVEAGTLELKLDRLEIGIAQLTEAWELTENARITGPLRSRVAYRLGIGHMRQGETQNCCRRPNADSCILPIRGGGLHVDTAGSEQAMAFFTEVLSAPGGPSPMKLKARWLLNVAAMTLDIWPDGVREAWRIDETALASDTEWLHFDNVAPELGLDTFDLAGGAVVDDLDGDNDLDIMVSTYDPRETPRVFLNQGDGTFVDATDRANLDGLTGGFNLVPADYDNDGDLDVLVLRGAWLRADGAIPDSLLRNDGHARFTDVTYPSGLGAVAAPSQTAAWADYDLDGDLDLYVGHEAMKASGPASRLWRNEGDGTFTDVTEALGVANHRYAKSVAWGDADGDGRPDLYVSNLGFPNRLYMNRDGGFTDEAGPRAVVAPLMSFASWFWDYDNDGSEDLYVAAYDWMRGGLAGWVADTLRDTQSHERSRLYRLGETARGPGGRDEGAPDVAPAVGLDALSLPMGANFGDLDNDGWLDVYLGTGYPDYEALVPNVVYRNDEGRGFTDVTWSSGLGHLQKGHAVVLADLDNDGDLDVFEQMGGFFEGDRYGNALFRNPGNENNWLGIELQGVQTNRSGLGAKITVVLHERQSERQLHRVAGQGGSFGGNPRRLHVGLGTAQSVDLEVHWPVSDTRSVFENVSGNQVLRIVEGADAYEVVDLESFPLGRL